MGFLLNNDHRRQSHSFNQLTEHLQVKAISLQSTFLL
tara:strand:+ start:9175 stop:9285 length:111 start_codon:yes stop_codon:yes gene_type:complete